MDYARFERLMIGGTAVVVVFTMAATAASHTLTYGEILGQLAIIAVMAVAVHWGRRAGTYAGLGACLLYLALSLPLLAAGPSTALLVVMLAHFAVYCLVGIVGGEAFGRMKYVFAGSRDADVIDSWSSLYSQRYAAHALKQALARHKRYGETFSAVVLRLDPALTASKRPEQVRSLVRTVAHFLRDDVRMVDEVARLDDGRFLVLLPHTPASSAPVVAQRLTDGLAGAIPAKPSMIGTQIFGTDPDTAALEQFANGLSPDEQDPSQPASGA